MNTGTLSGAAQAGVAARTDFVDHRTATARQRETWATGDFHEISRGITPVSEALCATVDPWPGARVLDVACGSGSTALVAARRYCDTTGIDFVPELVERARKRAAAEGVDIDFRTADAQALPFEDAAFDVALSVFGVMFAPNQRKAAAELLRICRPGGRIGLACWMPEDFGADFFGVHAQYLPPPPGIDSPLRSGTEAGLDDLLGAGTTSIRSEVRANRAYYLSIDHAIETFRRYFGPTGGVLANLDAGGQQRFLGDLHAVFRRYNAARDDTVVLETRYLESVAVRA